MFNSAHLASRIYKVQRDDIALRYIADFFSPEQAKDLFINLINEIHWRQDNVHIFGKTHPIPRLQAWYSDPAIDYIYSGLRLPHQAYPPNLLSVKKQLEAFLMTKFNGVLCNYYRTGEDHMGWHSDDEKSLGHNPLIASLSFGAERDFVLRNRQHNEKLTVNLQSGSLLIMSAGCQHTWQHALPKRKKIHTGRINLTFRRLLNSQ